MDRNDFRRDIKRDLKVMKRNKVISALTFIVIGVVLLAWPQETLTGVSRLIGLILALGGMVAVVMYFVNGSRALFSYAGLAGGVIVAVIGLWLFYNPAFIISLIPTIVGLLLIISGLVNLSEAFQIKKEHGEGVLMSAILAAITILLGIIIFTFQMQFASLVTRLMGIALVYDGVSDLLIISKITGVVKDVEYAAQQARKATDALDVTETAREVETPSAAATETETSEESEPRKAGEKGSRKSFLDRFLRGRKEIEVPLHAASEEDFEPEEAEAVPCAAQPSAEPVAAGGEETPSVEEAETAASDAQTPAEPVAGEE